VGGASERVGHAKMPLALASSSPCLAGCHVPVRAVEDRVHPAWEASECSAIIVGYERLGHVYDLPVFALDHDLNRVVSHGRTILNSTG
jgi:hypothetical protein